jgi:hypothetical protein
VKENCKVVGEVLSIEYEKGEEGFTSDRGICSTPPKKTKVLLAVISKGIKEAGSD